jgi:ABC-type antimicrobial peptide transport system permease subunit
MSRIWDIRHYRQIELMISHRYQLLKDVTDVKGALYIDHYFLIVVMRLRAPANSSYLILPLLVIQLLRRLNLRSIGYLA